MATATAEPAPVMNGAATSPIPDDTTTASSGTKRKREDSAPQADGAIKDDVPTATREELSPQLQESLKDILKLLRK